MASLSVLLLGVVGLVFGLRLYQARATQTHTELMNGYIEESIDSYVRLAIADDREGLLKLFAEMPVAYPNEEREELNRSIKNLYGGRLEDDSFDSSQLPVSDSAISLLNELNRDMVTERFPEYIRAGRYRYSKIIEARKLSSYYKVKVSLSRDGISWSTTQRFYLVTISDELRIFKIGLD